MSGSNVARLPSPPQSETNRRLIGQLTRLLGPVVCERLNDPLVFEVLLNDDGTLWEDRVGVGMRQIGTINATDSESSIRTVASMMGRTITEDNPVLECVLPIRGARFTASIPPLVPAPIYSIRLMAVEVFPLQDYVDKKMMTVNQRLAIEDGLTADPPMNIMVAGGTGSGKTTLLNAFLRYVSEETPDARVVIMQELYELQCMSKNKVSLQTTDQWDLTKLVRLTMRLRPDRPIIGEVRGGEALALLKLMNTGHSGTLFTIHANTARSALTRMEQLIAEATTAQKQPEIAEAIHMIVSIAKIKTKDGKSVRSVREVVRVDGYKNRNYILTPVE